MTTETDLLPHKQPLKPEDIVWLDKFITDQCNGIREWRMCIPVQHDDSDMVLCRILNHLKNTRTPLENTRGDESFDPYEDGECPHCGGDGYIEGDCTCGDDCCCCADPEPPVCTHCSQQEQQKTIEPAQYAVDIRALEEAIEFRREKAEAARKRHNSFYGMNKDDPPMHDVILWESARAHLQSLKGK